MKKLSDDLCPVQPAFFEDEGEEFQERVETSNLSEEVTKRRKKKMTSGISTDNQLLQLR